MKSNRKYNKLILFSISVVVILAVSLIYVASALAETTVTVEDCKIKVTVNIAITGEGATDAYANKVKEVAEKKWNDAKIKAGECNCEFSLTVNVIKVDNCRAPAAANQHCVTVKNVPVGTFHRSTVTGTANAWQQTGASNNANAPHIASGTGDWGNNDSDNMIAHEVGHLMGLDDEYTDVYFYYYANADGSRATPDQTVPVKDFTDAKKNEIAAAAPAGTHVVYHHENGNFVYSKPNAGKEKSLMASVAADAIPQDDHAADIAGDANVKCPDECCCGDGKVDANKKESCDPKANPNGCDDQHVCTADCKCAVRTPMCGDGHIDSATREQCDPKAKPTGCKEGETCQDNCTCKGKDDSTKPPDDDTTKTPDDDTKPPDDNDTITAVCGDGKITAPEECEPGTKYTCEIGLSCSNCMCITVDLADQDYDGVPDIEDNCPNVSNPNQADVDGNGVGEACDTYIPPPPADMDGDGFPDDSDNCPTTPNPDQTDSDGNGMGDACDTYQPPPPADIDGDGFPDDIDNCPSLPNPDQGDLDGDGLGNLCDPVNDLGTDLPLDPTTDIIIAN